jgi:hypothetical protein
MNFSIKIKREEITNILKEGVLGVCLVEPYNKWFSG